MEQGGEDSSRRKSRSTCPEGRTATGRKIPPPLLCRGITKKISQWDYIPAEECTKFPSNPPSINNRKGANKKNDSGKKKKTKKKKKHDWGRGTERESSSEYSHKRRRGMQTT